MSRPPEVVVHHDADVLAAAVAARLLTRLVDVQSTGRVPSVVLTGGGIARDVHRAVADSPARSAVDWARLDVWWGDERFVPAADDERNEAQARADLLDRAAAGPRPGARRSPPATGRSVPTSRRPRPTTATSWPPRPAPRTTATCPSSTC